MASDWNLNEAWCPYMDKEMVLVNDNGDFEDLVGFPLDLNVELFDSNMNATAQEQPAPQGLSNVSHHKRNRLSNDNMLKVSLFLMNRAKEGNLQYGSIKPASTGFNIYVSCVSGIWNSIKKYIETMLKDSVLTGCTCGRKVIQVQVDSITSLAMGQRSYIRDLACCKFSKAQSIG
ncbi:hypothetical protein BVRB_1g012820 [Beta vulgaris subsp. vulgaris]|nr:hypothetical protein BVRB_1g012820 [Beta vulgaris subsp. vulgaris]